MKKYFILPLLTLIILIILCSCVPQKPAQQCTASMKDNNPPKQLVLTAVGDIMMHNTQVLAGHSGQNNYDFSSFFSEVQPYFKTSDFVIGNLETTLTGSSAGYSGYPRFNSPEILAKNLKDCGFTLLTTANNHCLDKGVPGLISTLDFLDEADILHTGTSRDAEEQNKTLLAEINGIKVAFLAYTFGTNGLIPPKDKNFSVNYLEEDRVKTAIEKAKEEGAQLIVLSLHFGQEYQSHPNAQQKHFARSFISAGADIILGHHPHVLQPAEVIQVADNNKVRTGFVIYSLGNFISDQRGLPRKTSIILNLLIEAEEATGDPFLKNVSYIPIYTHRYYANGKLNFKVIPVESFLHENADLKLNLTPKDKLELEQAWEHITVVYPPIPDFFSLERV